MCFTMKQDRGKEVTVSIKYLYFKSSSAYDLNMLSHTSLQYASSGSPSWTEFSFDMNINLGSKEFSDDFSMSFFIFQRTVGG